MLFDERHTCPNMSLHVFALHMLASSFLFTSLVMITIRPTSGLDRGDRKYMGWSGWLPG
jgi:hypothetical protein